MRRIALTAVLACASTLVVHAQWPQWRGPNRDGVVPAAHVPADWPEALTAKWQHPVGEGYSSPVVADGRVFVHSRIDPNEVVTAFDLATGGEIWAARYPAAFVKNKYAASMQKGPFSTPLVAGGRLYTFGSTGVLSAFDAASGKLLWRKNWSKEIDTSKLFTGTAMSPIIEGGVLIVHVGDDGGGAFHAFDPATGDEKWTREGDGPGYASPIATDFGGVRQIVTLTDKSVVGLDVANGRALWSIPFPDDWNENIVTPVVAGDILVVSGTRQGTRGFRIARKGDAFAPAQVWHNTDLPMYMSSPVVDGTFVYGFSNRRKGQFFCLDATTGTARWTTEGREGTNAVVQSAGAHLVLTTTEGLVLIARRTPDRYDEVRRYEIGSAGTWGHPVLLGREIVLRSADAVGVWALGR